MRSMNMSGTSETIIGLYHFVGMLGMLYEISCVKLTTTIKVPIISQGIVSDTIALYDYEIMNDKDAFSLAVVSCYL